MRKSASLIIIYISILLSYFLNEESYKYETFLGWAIFLIIILCIALIPWLLILGISKLYKRINIVLNSAYICVLYVVCILLIPPFFEEIIRSYCFFDIPSDNFSLQIEGRECLKIVQGEIYLMFAVLLIFVFSNLDRIFPLEIIKMHYKKFLK